MQRRWEGEWTGWKEDKEKKKRSGTFLGGGGRVPIRAKTYKKKAKNNILKFPLLDWISGRQKRMRGRKGEREEDALFFCGRAHIQTTQKIHITCRTGQDMTGQDRTGQEKRDREGQERGT